MNFRETFGMAPLTRKQIEARIVELREKQQNFEGNKNIMDGDGKVVKVNAGMDSASKDLYEKIKKLENQLENMPQ